MQSFETILIQTSKILENIRGIFEKNNIQQKLEKISKEINKENFLERPKKAKSLTKEKKFFEDLVLSFNNLKKEINNLKDLHSLGADEENDEITKDCELKLKDLVKDLKNRSLLFFVRGK